MQVIGEYVSCFSICKKWIFCRIDHPPAAVDPLHTIELGVGDADGLGELVELVVGPLVVIALTFGRSADGGNDGPIPTAVGSGVGDGDSDVPTLGCSAGSGRRVAPIIPFEPKPGIATRKSVPKQTTKVAASTATLKRDMANDLEP